MPTPATARDNELTVTGVDSGLPAAEVADRAAPQTSCCPAAEYQSCCEASAKASCCGSSTSGGCGCR